MTSTGVPGTEALAARTSAVSAGDAARAAGGIGSASARRLRQEGSASMAAKRRATTWCSDGATVTTGTATGRGQKGS